MSNCRTFNRSSRKEQPKQQQNIGIRALQKMAHEMIARNPQKYLDKLEQLFFELDRVTAAGMIIALAAGAEMEEVVQAVIRRPSFIAELTARIEQEEQEIAAREAEAAQEATTRELGQFPEPETATETAAVEPPTAQIVSNLSNTHINEIGLPVRGHSQTIDAPGSRSCRAIVRPATPGHESNQVMLLPAHRTV
jgi:hypothetical protein